MNDIPQVIRPTPLSEKTLVGALIGFNVNLIVFTMFLAWKHWPDVNADKIIGYIGAALIILAFGNLLIVAGFLSPWIGTIRLSGMGVNLDVSGAGEPPANPPAA